MRMRLMLGTLIAFVLFSLCTYHWLYCDFHGLPDNEEVILSGSDYVGEEVSLIGTVIDSDKMLITIKEGGIKKDVEITGFSEDVSEGDILEVLGIMVDENKINADKVIVYEKMSYIFIFVRSIFAIPLLAILFFRYWKFDFREFVFRRR